MVGRLAQLPTPADHAARGELLERFELTDAADRPVRTYSGGMRRRLDIAASLVQRPPVLFLDEPTTGLDLTSRNELWDMIRELVRDGTTVLLTTQYLEEADRLAERIAVIDGGKVIANDTPAELKAQLGSTVVEMRFDGDGRSTDAETILTGTVDGQVERDDGIARASRPTRARSILIDVLRTLDASGVEPDALTVREPSLDDVFLALTGHQAEADGEPSEEPVEGRRGGSRMSAIHGRDGEHPIARDRGSRAAGCATPCAVIKRNLHRVPARAAAAGVLDDPADHLRADVPVRVRRRRSTPAGIPYVDFLMPGIFVQTSCSARSPRRSGWRPT